LARFCCQCPASPGIHPQTGLNTNRHHMVTLTNHERQEPGTEQNQQEQFNCHKLLLLRSPTVRSCHQPSVGSLTNCQQGSPAVPLQATSVSRASNTTSAKSSLPIGSSLHMTSNRPFSWSFSPDHQTRCNSQLMQAWLTSPCSGRWTSTRTQPSAGTIEQKRSTHRTSTAIITSLSSATRRRVS